MGKIGKHALIDVVEWKPQSNDILAYRFPHSNLSTGTQLIVRESQEAIFFSKGQIIGSFSAGKHTLSTQNLPLLRTLYGIPFGGNNPFTAEVWFVNKTAPLNIDWKTSSMRYMDPDYGEMVPLVAKGRYGLKVYDAERFLVELVGTMESFTARELTDHFMGALIAKTNSSIIAFMTANHVGINQIAVYLDQLSTFIRQPMQEFWEAYGFYLAGFYITEVNLDLSSSEGRKISEALTERSAQRIAGYTWQQKQTFDVANNATGQGSSMGILGVAMMAGAFGNNAALANGILQPPVDNQMQNQYNTATRTNRRTEVFCSNCGKKYSTSSRFCPHCGDAYNPCPACGADNAGNSTRCIVCGTILQSGVISEDVCLKCRTPIHPGDKFCPGCGNKIS